MLFRMTGDAQASTSSAHTHLLVAHGGVDLLTPVAVLPLQRAPVVHQQVLTGDIPAFAPIFSVF